MNQNIASEVESPIADTHDTAGEIARLRRINAVLMDRVERGVDMRGNAYSLFETAIKLEKEIRERSAGLEAARSRLVELADSLAGAKDKAEASESRLTAAIESINEGFALYDSNERLILCNSIFREFWRQNSGEAGKEDSAEEFSKRVAQGRRTLRMMLQEDKWLSKDLLDVAVAKTPEVRQLPDGRFIQISEQWTGEGFIVGVYTDVTDLQAEIAVRTRAEQRLAQARVVAEEANRAKSRFLAGASHDILQPLTAARLFVSAAADGKLSDKEWEAYLVKASTALSTAEDILETLIEISRIESGKLAPELREFRVGDLVDELCSNFAPAAERNKVDLRVVLSSCIVRSDPKLLRRILQNLLSNALRYTRGGRVLVGCRRSREGVRVEVIDTGPGIPTEQQSLIFEEFRQFKHREEAPNRGVGLGLSVVRQATRALGTQVELRSVVGRGSTFSVTVPFGTGLNLPVSASAKRTCVDRKEDPFSGLRVLVVDDNPEIAEGLAATLGGWGCNVLSTTSARQARKLCEEWGAPDFAVVDYQLGESETGLELIAEMRSAFKVSIPALIVTAAPIDLNCNLGGVSDVSLLYKPIHPSQLRAELGAHFAPQPTRIEQTTW